jgi:hypothetical protein
MLQLLLFHISARLESTYICAAGVMRLGQDREDRSHVVALKTEAGSCQVCARHLSRVWLLDYFRHVEP